MPHLNHNISGTDNCIVCLIRDITGDEEIITPAGLFGIATCNWLSDTLKMGIPAELVHRVYDDYQGLQVAASRPDKDQKLNIACITPGGKGALKHILQLVSIFNLTTRFTLSIHCTPDQFGIIKPFANDHLLFTVQPEGQQPLKAPFSCDLIITYGPGALHFMKQAIPVVVIGPYGFGGLITADNFNYLLNNGFCGRPGGYFNEVIPPMLVQEELLAIHGMDNLQAITGTVKTLADNLPYSPLSKVSELVAKARSLYDQIYHEKARLALKPVIAANVEFICKEEIFVLRRICINDTIAILNKQELFFFRQINGDNDCRTLHAVSKMPEKEFWKFMYTLWDKKIILF
jgi:hypothetical protein